MKSAAPILRKWKLTELLFPNHRNIWRPLLKDNDGQAAFSCLLKRCFCQQWCFDGETSQQRREKSDYLHNASSCWPEKTCRFSSTAHMRALNISLPTGIQSPSKLLSAVPPSLCSTFLIRFPTPMHPKYIWSVGFDAMHSSVKPIKIAEYPWWVIYGKFGFLATEYSIAFSEEFPVAIQTERSAALSLYAFLSYQKVWNNWFSCFEWEHNCV